LKYQFDYKVVGYNCQLILVLLGLGLGVVRLGTLDLLLVGCVVCHRPLAYREE